MRSSTPTRRRQLNCPDVVAEYKVAIQPPSQALIEALARSTSETGNVTTSSFISTPRTVCVGLVGSLLWSVLVMWPPLIAVASKLTPSSFGSRPWISPVATRDAGRQPLTWASTSCEASRRQLDRRILASDSLEANT